MVKYDCGFYFMVVIWCLVMRANFHSCGKSFLIINFIAKWSISFPFLCFHVFLMQLPRYKCLMLFCNLASSITGISQVDQTTCLCNCCFFIQVILFLIVCFEPSVFLYTSKMTGNSLTFQTQNWRGMFQRHPLIYISIKKLSRKP